MKKTIDEIAIEDGRYNRRAVRFVYEGLGVTVDKIRQAESVSEHGPHHISGAQLAMGLADLAIARWGRLSKMVLNRWGIFTTRDFGEIVFLMISYNWMSAQESDSIEDFEDVFDFEQIFEKQFKFVI
jgi:uncharacterized repeat protein (TIGR04138 family)